MPEGPEVRVIAEGLDFRLRGKNITGLHVMSGRYSKSSPPLFDEFRGLLPVGCTGVYSKGKFIWFELEGDAFIWNTLGMTGSWFENPPERDHRATTYQRIRLEYDGGTVYFVDRRNFGTLKFSFLRDSLDKKLGSLGMDMLSEDIDLDRFKEMLAKKRLQEKTMAEVMMDQRIFAGVGNYLKAEILWRCCISPHRRVKDLSDDDIYELCTLTSTTMNQAYEARRGAVNAHGQDTESGAEAYRWTSGFEFMVYNRNEDGLGNEVVREKTKDGRTTHWAPAMQI